MRRAVPKVLVDLPLAEYSPDFGGEVLRVWVNISDELTRERVGILLASQGMGAAVAKRNTVPAKKGLLSRLRKEKDNGQPATEAVFMQSVLDKVEVSKRRSFAWLSQVFSQGHNPDEHVSEEDIETWYGQSPEFVEDGLNAAARGERVTEPHIQAVWIAQRINHLHGGAVIAAWDVDTLDELWLQALLGLSDLPQRQAPQKAINAKFAEFRAKHPTYRKH
jgi:hypothetical protein